MFASVEALFGHLEENTILFLSKLIYHLVHCLLYRPFLPLDLLELRGTGQHQSWQIEATRLCFSHANTITELVELGRTSPVSIEWPALVAYCICTAGTIHIHGAHYGSSTSSDRDTHREDAIFSSSAELLAREMNQLSWLREYWTGVQHQRETLQTLYTCHAELIRMLTGGQMRLAPVLHLEHFMDRYAGVVVYAGHVRLADSNSNIPMHFDRSHQPATVYQQDLAPAAPFSPIMALSPPVFTPPSSTSQHAAFSFDNAAVQVRVKLSPQIRNRPSRRLMDPINQPQQKQPRQLSTITTRWRKTLSSVCWKWPRTRRIQLVSERWMGFV